MNNKEGLIVDLKEYVEKATQTESRVDEVVVDPQFYASVVQVMIAAGNMLDQIKKHVFYQREYDTDKLVAEFTNIVGSLDDLKQAVVNIKSGDAVEAGIQINPRLFHSVVGLTTETTELLEGVTQPEFDLVNFIEELGDLNWYQAIGIDAYDLSFEDILETNIKKLQSSDKARYKDGFSADDANNRDIEAEREVLESGNNP